MILLCGLISKWFSLCMLLDCGNLAWELFGLTCFALSREGNKTAHFIASSKVPKRTPKYTLFQEIRNSGFREFIWNCIIGNLYRFIYFSFNLLLSTNYYYIYLIFNQRLQHVSDPD